MGLEQQLYRIFFSHHSSWATLDRCIHRWSKAHYNMVCELSSIVQSPLIFFFISFVLRLNIILKIPLGWSNFNIAARFIFTFKTILCNCGCLRPWQYAHTNTWCFCKLLCPKRNRDQRLTFVFFSFSRRYRKPLLGGKLMQVQNWCLHGHLQSNTILRTYQKHCKTLSSHCIFTWQCK